MAYVPPHKRHADAAKKAPVPDSLAPRIQEQLNLGSGPGSHGKKTRSFVQGQKLFYDKDSISRWWPVGSTTEDPVPASFRLEPVSHRSVLLNSGETTFVLVRGQACEEESVEGRKEEPWVAITDKILPDVVAAVENVTNQLKLDDYVRKASFVARFGKILFHGESSHSLDSIRKAAGWQVESRGKLYKLFNTNVPVEFLEHVENTIPSIGMDFEAEKEHYHVKISDKNLPDSTISCKCTVLESKKELKICKVELNMVRHLVVDLSCIYKDLDLRIMLCQKRILVDIDDVKKDCIEKLIKAAIIDHDVKGGLRWPLGQRLNDRFEVVGVWHTSIKYFTGSSVNLKLRKADRFDFRTSLGEASMEATLKLTELTQFIEEGTVEVDPIKRILEGNIELIWKHFLNGKYPLA